MPEWQDADEERLLEAAKAGDYAAYGELYVRYAPQVFRFIYARID